MNRRQAGRLRSLSEYLHNHSNSFFMIELLVPAEESQLERVKGDQNAYDRLLRPQLMVEAIEQLQKAEVEPDVWKVEGLYSPKDCEEIVAVARRDGRGKVGCIVLGRGQDERKVRDWLATAAAVPGFIGFAVGRTTFWNSLVK
jgi:myo-inositol catabolism protein IolC